MMKNILLNFKSWVLTFLCLSPLILFSQTWLWTNTAGRYHDENGECTVIDSSGNIYVAGYFNDTLTLGSNVLISAGGNDVFIAKYNSSGTLVWAESAGGTGEDDAGSIAVDAQGNVFIGGWFSNTCRVGTNSFVSRGGNDLFVAKITSSGTPLWFFVAGGTGTDKVMGITTDSYGNCLVTGSFQTTLYFGSQTYTSPGSDETFVARFSPSGTPQWFLQGGFNTSDCWPSGIGRDGANNAYIAGAFKENATFGSTTLSSNGTNSNIYIAKIDTGGHFKWAKTVTGPLDDFSNGLIADDSGYVYVTGSFFDTLTFPNFRMASAGSKDGFVLQLDSAGTYLWAHNIGGANSDKGIEIGIDNKRNCYVTGFINGVSHFNNKTVNGYGGDDIFIAKYDMYGNIKWVELAGSTGSDYGMGLGSDYHGNMTVTGSFQNRGYFGGTYKNATGGKDFFISKLTLIPVVKQEPMAASKCAGSSQTFRFKVTGEAPMNYRWQRNGVNISSAPNDTFLTINNPGSYDSASYRCIIQNAYGADTTVQAFLTVYPLPVVKLGADTSFCMGGSKKLDAGKGFSAYNWSNGITTQSQTISNSANIWVTVKDKNSCTSKADTIVITVYLRPVFKFGNDTSFCSGDSLVLNAGSGFKSFSWSDGFKGQIRTVKTTKTLWVTVTDTTHSCQSLPDTIKITVNQLPSIKNIKDTTFCKGPVITLDEGITTGYSYKWYYQPGNKLISNTHQILTDSTGIYIALITDQKGCKNYDSVHVSVYALPQKPIITIGGSTEICKGDSVVLSAPTGYSAFLWSDNSVNREIVIKTSATLNVNVFDQHNCKSPASDNIKIIVNPLPPKPSITIIGDSAVCEGDSIELSASPGYPAYDWSTGDKKQEIAVFTTKKVSVFVVDTNGCKSPESDLQAATIYSKPPKPTIQEKSKNELECLVVADNYNWFSAALPSDKKNLYPKHTKVIDSLRTLTYYWVVITDSNGCLSDTSVAYFYNHSSIMNNNNIQMAITPNPSSEYIALSVPLRSSDKISIYNSLGMLMQQNQYRDAEKKLDISRLQKGLYLIILRHDDKTYLGKFVKQ
jgi:hypothetical protein